MIVTISNAWGQTQSSVIQSVTVEVKPISKLVVVGSPRPLMITDAVVPSGSLAVSDESSRYSLVTNLDNMKIVASVNDGMPKGTRLTINLSSSKGASAGFVDISEATNPVDVVTGLSRTSDLNQSISYAFAANPDVYDVPTQSRIVTLTLTD